MELGEIIDSIRKSKGFEIKEIIGTRMSRSAYSRFVNNQADTSTENLRFLLSKLNISYHELENFGYHTSNIHLSKVSLVIKEVFEKQSVTELSKIQKVFGTYTDFNSTEHHLYCLLDILIKQIEKISFDIYDNDLYKYLISVESWTHYEIVLYNNVMFAFPSDINKLLIDKAIYGLKRYAISYYYGDELFRLVANCVVLYLQEKDINNTWKYLEVLNSISLSEDAIFERVTKTFLNGIFDKILTPEEKHLEIRYSLNIFKWLESNNIYEMNKSLLDQLSNLYDVTFE